MAATLSEIADLATWPPFMRRIRAAVAKAAVDIGAELAAETPRSQIRRSLSVNVFASLDDYTARFALAVARNPVITNDSSDSDIEFTVNSVWDVIAGAPPA